MKLEIFILGITLFFIANTYLDGNLINKLKSYQKYYKIALFAFIGLCVYLFLKKSPHNCKDLLMNAYQRVKNSEKTYTQIANELSTIANEFGKEAILRASIKIISEDKAVNKNDLEILFDLSESLQIPRAYVRGIFIEEEIISK